MPTIYIRPALTPEEVAALPVYEDITQAPPGQVVRLVNNVTHESRALSRILEEMEARPGGVSNDVSAAFIGAAMIANGLPVDDVEGSSFEEQALNYLQGALGECELVEDAARRMRQPPRRATEALGLSIWDLLDED